MDIENDLQKKKREFYVRKQNLENHTLKIYNGKSVKLFFFT